MTRFRITIRSDEPRMELRGYADFISQADIERFARAMEPYGLVIGSLADKDYDPFGAEL